MTPHVRQALRDLQHRARPRQEFNPGVSTVLVREGWALSVWNASPYPTHRGKQIEHLCITQKGVDALAQAGT